MNTEQQHLILVLGMHRSGTSTITRGLQTLGIDLGSHLLQAMPEVNAKGFFEDIDFYRFNEKLLKKLSSSWHSLAAIELKNISEQELILLKEEALGLLRSRFQSSHIFGLKDPRFSRLLEFWQPIFQQANLKVSYILACRNPISVANSLRNRDKFQPIKAYHLWLNYMLSALLNIVDKNFTIVEYDNLIQNPTKEITRISNFLAYKFEPESKLFQDYLNDFVDNSLRHWHFTREDLEQDSSIPNEAIELYQILANFAQDLIPFNQSDLCKQLKQIHLSHLESEANLEYMQWLDQQIEILNKTIKSQQQKIISLEGAYRQLVDLSQQQSDNLNHKISTLDATINKLQQELEEKDKSSKAIFSSNSWLITKPLRLVAQTIRKLAYRLQAIIRNFRD